MKIPYPMTLHAMNDTPCVNCQQPMREHWNAKWACPEGTSRWSAPPGCDWWLDGPADTRRERAELGKAAMDRGLRIETLGNGADENRFWLVRNINWATTEPGRTLAEIRAELDELDLQDDGGKQCRPY